MSERSAARQRLLDTIVELRRELQGAGEQAGDEPALLNQLDDILRATDELQQLIIDASHEWVKILDLEGNLLSITYGGLPVIEPRAETAVSWLDWWRGEERKAADDALTAARKGHVAFFLTRSTTGRPRWLEVIVAPIPNGRNLPQSLLVVSRDVTHFRKIEEELQQKNEQLLRANDGLQIAEDELKRQNAELQKARYALEKERERYRELFEFAPDGYLLTDLRGSILEANKAAAKQLRASAKNLVGSSLSNYLDADGKREFVQRLAAAAEVEGPLAWELRLCPVEGEPFDAEVMVAATRRGGCAAGLRWLVRSISERKNIERVLRSSEMRLRRVVDSNIVGVAFGDGSGAIREANDAFLNIVGYSREDLASGALSWRVLTPPESLEGGLENLFEARLATTGKPRERECLRKDGNRVPVLIGGALIEAPTLECVCFVIDITDRKRAEAALRESEQRYRTIGESIAYGVWAADAGGRVVFVSQSMLDLVGMTCEEVRDFGWTRCLEASVAEAVVSRWLQCVRTGADWAGEFEIRAADGGCRTVLSHGKPVRDAAGQITSWVGINLDITDRKRAEAALERHAEELRTKTQELSASNEELERYAYAISHDLRAPLVGLTGSLELLAEQLQGRLSAEEAENVEQALQSVDRMGQLIKALLDYGRVGAGGLKVADCDCGAVFEAATRNLAAEIDRLGAEVTSSPLPVVRGDKQLLIEAFQNLIENGIKYHGPQPPRVHVSARQGQREWIFAVSDNGIGLNPEDFERIFRLFDRVSSEHARPGTGIGLATCKKIVERHGGRIWVESQPGQGATFYFSISK